MPTQKTKPVLIRADETEEDQWWESHFNRHFPNPEDSWVKTWAHFLVAEAMRRGEEKALERIKGIHKQSDALEETFAGAYCCGFRDACVKIESALSKPVTPGER